MWISDVTNEEKMRAYKFFKKYFKETNKQIVELKLNCGIRILYNQFNRCLTLVGEKYPLICGLPQEVIPTSLANKLIKEVGIHWNQYGYVKDRYKE